MRGFLRVLAPNPKPGSGRQDLPHTMSQINYIPRGNFSEKLIKIVDQIRRNSLLFYKSTDLTTRKMEPCDYCTLKLIR
jgi:hypothetical protein